MRKLYLVLILLVTFLNVKAQFSSATPKDRERIAGKVTHVILTGNEKFDKSLKDNLKKHWTINKLEYNDVEYFNKNIFDKEQYFIKVFDLQFINQRSITLTLDTSKGTRIAFLQGNKNFDFNYYPDLFVLGDIFLNTMGNENKLELCTYRMKNIIQQLDNCLNLTMNKEFVSHSPPYWFKFYAKRGKELRKTKTVLLCEEDLDGFSKTEISKIFKGKFEVVNKAKLNKIIEDGNDGYCYVQQVCEYSINYLSIIDTKNGTPLLFQQIFSFEIHKKITLKYLEKLLNDF